MNKRELVEEAMHLCERDLTKADMAEALECIVNVISNELEAGSRIDIKNFASFGVKTRAARKGFNPSTGTTMDIPEKVVPFCKISKSISVLPRL